MDLAPRQFQATQAATGVIVGALLLADAVFLMTLRHFGLGVWLPLVFGAGLLALGLRWNVVWRWRRADARRQRAWQLLRRVLAVWLTTLVAFWGFLTWSMATSARDADASAPAAIVVLGSGTPGGRASPLLAARLDAALRQATRWPQATVLVSGGIGWGERVSEAQVMGDYLRARGLAAGRISQEEASTSTEANLRLSRSLLERHGIDAAASIHLVTSDFHTLRAGWIARRTGYTRVTLIGAPTPLYVRYNAWLREYFAVLSGLALREFG